MMDETAILGIHLTGVKRPFCSPSADCGTPYPVRRMPPSTPRERRAIPRPTRHDQVAVSHGDTRHGEHAAFRWESPRRRPSGPAYSPNAYELGRVPARKLPLELPPAEEPQEIRGDSAGERNRSQLACPVRGMSPVARGRLAIHSWISSASQATARGPSFSGIGKVPICIWR